MATLDLLQRAGSPAVTASLAALIGAELRPPPGDGPQAAAMAARVRFGDAVCAVLYYGSCLRRGSDEDGIIDLYVLVDSYRGAYGPGLLALANALLPPNVFYLETGTGGRTVRAKVAVMSLAHFVRRSSPRCFSPALWGRFAQPSALLYARDERTAATLERALASAVQALLVHTLPLLPARFDALEPWIRGLAECYRTELRPEAPQATARHLVEAAAARCRRLTHAALGPPAPGTQGYDTPARPAHRRRAAIAWRARRVQGKLLNLLRLIKAAFTFNGGVDYLLWKVERHSGVRVEASAAMRRHPLLAIWSTAWRLYRMGAFR